ncbi:MAG: HAD hydrolase-like protein, partial [Chloroflexota bacterium]|nr:HAD hydrolase-like protein [Chloroflexota bacterium]
LYTQTYGHPPTQMGKPGCIHFEVPLLPLEEVRSTFEILRQQGYVLGFATGRVRQEAEYPLKMYGLLDYFDDQHLSTYDAVEQAEAQLRARGDQTLLSKPDPFPFLIAVDRHYQEIRAGNLAATEESKKSVHTSFIVVGDSTSDILGGRAAGAVTVAVLTGARTPEACNLLARSGPDFTIDDMTKLPALLTDIANLATIQHMQFSEREKAERLLQLWFERHMNLSTESVTLIPRATSLNSFNGLYRSEGEEYFFKTHVEEQGILEEYYNAELLHEAGYNIVLPVRMLHEKGRQMVIYPVVRWPVMFDLMHAVETGNAENVTLEMLVSAEQQECKRLLTIYRSTLSSNTSEENAGAAAPNEDTQDSSKLSTHPTMANTHVSSVGAGLAPALSTPTLHTTTPYAPIHQLFWHRLTGERFKSFYEGKHVPFPERTHQPQRTQQQPVSQRVTTRVAPTRHEKPGISFDDLLTYHWVINGVAQQLTLEELVERAKLVLNPTRPTATVIGHGDAHFGNVFLHMNPPRYLYFDPAFAGRHSPLLDVIKPLFHNVFATWMYFPHEIAQNLQLSVSVQHTTLFVEHNYTLTMIRQAILQTKIEHLLTPLLDELRSRAALPADWAAIMQSALLCCALLTVNLLDEERMPPTISWLGLLLAVQMGNNGIQPWGNDAIIERQAAPMLPQSILMEPPERNEL